LPHPEDGGQLLHSEFSGQQDRYQAQAARVGKGFEGFEHGYIINPDLYKSTFLDIAFRLAIGKEKSNAGRRMAAYPEIP
jgi:hypothetical protein